MAKVLVIQRNAHLAAGVRIEFVQTRDGELAKGTLTAISNARRGTGEDREEATAIQWTLWGKQAEAAAVYLCKGSHVNVVGRMRNDVWERDGQVVYGMTFTAEEIDYLDSRAEGEARRDRIDGGGSGGGEAPDEERGEAGGQSRSRHEATRKARAAA